SDNVGVVSHALALSLDGGTTFNAFASGVPGTAQSFSFVLPASLDSTMARVRVTASDAAGNSASDISDADFTIRPASSGNLPPTIAAIGDQTVTAGDVRTVAVSASDPDNDTLRLSIVASPAFVSLSDNGNGTGTIRIAPAVTDTTGGRVTVQVTDAGGLSATVSFNVTIVPFS